MNMSPNATSQGLIGSDPHTPERRPLIVVAGRSEDARQMMRAMLESWDLDVTVAGSCSEAPEVAGQLHPDLVMLDAAIPFTESLEAAAMLRNQPPTANIPVLMISDFTQSPFRDAAMAQGVADYVTKPCSLDELHETVLNLLQRPQSPRPVHRAYRNRPRIMPNSVL
jgi:two-component system alkaline phosphatase synthesis response regulator PhoP